MRVGIVDVMEFLRQVPTEVIDFWCEYDAEYPLNDHDMRWQQFANQMTMLWQIYATQLAANGVDVDPFDVTKYLPKRMQPKEKAFESGSELQSKINARFG